MLLVLLLFWIALAGSTATAQGVQGIVDLVQRRMPDHVDKFKFILHNASSIANHSNELDTYVVSSVPNGTIVVQGSTLSALSSG